MFCCGGFEIGYNLLFQVLNCSRLWSHLEQLHLCFNNISVITNPSPLLANLTLLNLEGNNIGEWNQVLNLGGLYKYVFYVIFSKSSEASSN